MTFGERVKKYRKQANLTQEDLAKSIGKYKSFISSIENGKRSTGFDNIQLIAKALGITVDDLTDNVQPNNWASEYIPYIMKMAEDDPEKLRIIREMLGMPKAEKNDGQSMKMA